MSHASVGLLACRCTRDQVREHIAAVIEQHPAPEGAAHAPRDLFRAVITALAEVARSIESRAQHDTHGPPPFDSLFILDVCLIDVLLKVAPASVPEIRAKREEAWAQHGDTNAIYGGLWGGAEPRLPRLIVLALWQHLVLPLWKDELASRERKSTLIAPAAASAVQETIIETLHSPQRIVMDHQFISSGQVLAELDPTRAAASPVMRGVIVETLLSDREKDLRSLACQQLVRHLFRYGFEKDVEGDPDKWRFEARGGVAGLQRDLDGKQNQRKVTQLRRIIHLLDALRIPWPLCGSKPLFFVEDLRAANQTTGEPGRLILKLGDVLLPGYVTRMPATTRKQQAARRLIPITDFPPFALSPDRWGSEAILQMLLLAEMSSRAREFVERGGHLELDTRTWDRLADRAEISARNLSRVKEGWLSPGHGRPSFLTRTGPLWGLADAHRAARDLLLETGHRSLRGMERVKRRRKK